MSFSRRALLSVDWRLLAAAAGLAALGVLIIYSTSGMHASLLRRSLYLKQATWMVIGLFAMALLCLFPYRTTWHIAYLFYGVLLVALLLVALLGRTGMGAQRWLSIGSFAIQPSEFMKLSLILLLARYFEDRREQLNAPRVFIVPILLTLLPTALVLRQPDLGTAIMLLLISASILIMMGLKIRWFVLLGAVGSAITPVLWHYLHDYQKNRILVFLYPDMDPMGAGYHVAQSKIAVGSGGLIGKGWMAATQSQLNFLPENHTDFVFAGLAEQGGFFGSLCLLLVYAYLLSRGLRLARDAHDLFTMVTSFGIVSMIAWQVVINIGMVTGIMPVVGIPLPLLSYGGSSMLMNMLAIGLLLNIQKSRYQY